MACGAFALARLSEVRALAADPSSARTGGLRRVRLTDDSGTGRSRKGRAMTKKKISRFRLLALFPLAIALVAALHGDRAAHAQSSPAPKDGEARSRAPAARSTASSRRAATGRSTKEGGSSATTPSATRRSGATRSGCTRRSPARRTEGRARREPEDGARRRASRSTPTRCRARSSQAAQPRRGRPRRSGDDARAAAARRGRRRDGCSTRTALDVGRHPVRALPLDRRRFVRARHRPSPRRLGEPRSERRGDRRAVARPLAPSTKLLGVDEATVRAVLASWGPGSSTRSSSSTARRSGRTASRRATLIPPAFGLAGVNLHTYTGWGSSRTGTRSSRTSRCTARATSSTRASTTPRSSPSRRAHGFGHVAGRSQDLVTPKLAGAARLPARDAGAAPPAGSFDAAAAARGDALFEGKAKCAPVTCRRSTTEPGWNMHTAAEIGIDDFQSSRAPDRRYRTTPLARPVDARRRAASTTTAASRRCSTS